VNVSAYKLPVNDFSQYQWLSDNSMLYRTGPGRGPAARVFRVQGMQFGQARELLGLSATVSYTRRKVLVAPEDLLASPDGKSVAWRGYPNLLYVANLDGSRLRSVTIPGVFKAAWRTDSKGVVLFERDIDVTNSITVGVCDVTASKLSHTRYVRAGGLDRAESYPGRVGIFGLRALQNNAALFCQARIQPDELGSQVLVSYLRAGRLAERPMSHLVKLPVASEVYPVVSISPSGQMIAWALIADNRVQVWITDIRGDGARFIGHADSGAGYAPFNDLAWRLDGKALSFTLKGEFYVVTLGGVLAAEAQAVGQSGEAHRVDLPVKSDMARCVSYSSESVLGVFQSKTIDGVAGGELAEVGTRSQNLREMPCTMENCTDYALLSPDKRKLLVLEPVGHGYRWLVKGTDGVSSEIRSAQLVGEPQAVWLPDSSGWVQCNEPGQKSTLDIFKLGSRNVKSDRVCEIDGSPALVRLISCPDSNHVLCFESTRAYRERPESKQLISYNLQDGRLSSDRIEVTFVKIARSRLIAAVLSPDQQRLCWCFVSRSSEAGSLMDGLVATFWVTDARGAYPRSLFSLQIPDRRLFLDRNSIDSDWPLPQSVQWSSDGKQIAHLEKGELWAIPVPDTAGLSAAGIGR
jgi:hypothetical protein